MCFLYILTICSYSVLHNIDRDCCARRKALVTNPSNAARPGSSLDKQPLLHHIIDGEVMLGTKYCKEEL